MESVSLSLAPLVPFIQIPGSPSWGDGNLVVVGEAQRGQERTLKSHSKLEIGLFPNPDKDRPKCEGLGSKV